MAWTLQLLNDDTTLDLNDGSAYSGRAGFLAPPPPVRVAQGGANLFRHGSDIRERVYANRTVTAVIRIHGTSQDNLIANILAVNNLLERAAEYSTSGLGSQVKLRRKWENATNQVDFHVISGTLTLGDEFGPVHSQNTTFASAVLQLTCKPFAYGAEETLKNDVKDAGFEVVETTLADWTANHTGSGTSAANGTKKKGGNISLKLVMTSSSSGQVIERNQVLADVDAGEVWSFQCWVLVEALNNCKVVMEADYNTGTDVEVSTTTVGTEFVKLTMDNNTVPGSVTQVTLRLRLEATGAGATGTVYIDNVSAIQAASSTTAWISGKAVANSGADNGQVSTNYVDILDVPGDVPAELQVRILEQMAHSEVWTGARHGGRVNDILWLEGESGTGVTIRAIAHLTETPAASNSDAAFSDGAARYSQLEITSSGISAINTAETWFRHDFTIGTPVPKGQFRVLIGAWAENGQGGTTLTLNADDFQFGVGYTYGAFNLLNVTDPDTTSFVGLPSESMTENTTSKRTILDLGTVTIPPVSTPDNQTEASFVLSIFEHFDNVSVSGTHNGQEWNWHLDFVMLMPVDFGATYVSKTSGTDVVLLDSMSDTKGVYLLNSSDVVQSFPSNQLGRSPEAHPDGTRIYIMGQSTTFDYTVGANFSVSATYRPRFLHVMGA